MTTSKNLVSLRFASSLDYKDNLSTLISLVDKADDGAIIVAPEVCLTDYDYDNFENAIAFTPYAIEKLLLHVKNKTLVLTLIEKQDDGIYNVAKVLHKGKVIHNQAKAKLFKFGDEHHYFKSGDESDVQIFEVDGIKMGLLICFELRFKHFWKQLEGADIIALPSRWGKLRSQNFVTLTNALAIINQCYVVASDASNEDFTGQSGIITPFGLEVRNGDAEFLSQPFETSEIKKMRRYMDVGIS
ncbi:MAG: carbon-nitrogen hydrolase family protein [Campylobacterota bacterium]|nr:carbon-nitrogen hydrolase family protein [Campylobacterota bacterium]